MGACTPQDSHPRRRFVLIIQARLSQPVPVRKPWCTITLPPVVRYADQETGDRVGDLVGLRGPVEYLP